MPEEAEYDRKHKNYGAGDVRRFTLVAGPAADDTDHERKRSGGQDHTAGINANTADPFLEIVAFGSEYKPLIPQEGERDTEQIGEQAGYHISVGKDGSQEQCEPSEATVSEDRVASTDG